MEEKRMEFLYSKEKNIPKMILLDSKMPKVYGLELPGVSKMWIRKDYPCCSAHIL